MSDTRITIESCSVCGKRHKGVELRELSQKRTPWTHFYTCPETSDPVLTYLATRDDGTFITPHQDLIDSMVDAEKVGNIMGIVFRRKGGKIEMQRVTKNFDREDFGKCLDMFKDYIDEHGMPQKKELPEAEPPRPAVNLFTKPKAQLVDAQGIPINVARNQ